MSTSNVIEEINKLAGEEIYGITITIKGHGVLQENSDRYDVLNALRYILREVKNAKTDKKV